MHVEAALGAVRHPGLEFALEVGLHLQQLDPEHLRVDHDRVIASSGGGRFVDELVGLGGLLGDGVDGSFEVPRSRRAMLLTLALGVADDRFARCHGVLEVLRE